MHSGHEARCEKRTKRKRWRGKGKTMTSKLKLIQNLRDQIDTYLKPKRLNVYFAQKF